MLASGTQHSLRIVLSAILKPGDQVWCEDPGYPAARKAIEHCGQRTVAVPVDASGIIVAKGRALAPSAGAAYVTPSHQFPLGVQMSMPRRLELLDWARDADAFVLEDDYDSEFRYDGAPLLSLAGIDHLRRVIYMGTFAKTLFPGLRIGYCALPERLIGPVTAARAALDRFPGTLLEGAVADMLNSGAFAANLRKVRGLYREARDALASTLSTASERTAIGAGAVAGPASGRSVRSGDRSARCRQGKDRRRCRRLAAGGNLPPRAAAAGFRARVCRPSDAATDRIGRAAGKIIAGRPACRPQGEERAMIVIPRRVVSLAHHERIGRNVLCGRNPHALGFEIFADRIDAALAPEPRMLHAAERHHAIRIELSTSVKMVGSTNWPTTRPLRDHRRPMRIAAASLSSPSSTTS